MIFYMIPDRPGDQAYDARGSTALTRRRWMVPRAPSPPFRWR